MNGWPWKRPWRDMPLPSRTPPRRSHSAAAQGGMQASLGNSPMGRHDHPDLHFADTVRGSDWGCDQPVARLFVEHAPEAVREMARWGVPWTRVEEPGQRRGLIAGRNFGGTQKWRACHTADGTHSMLYDSGQPDRSSAFPCTTYGSPLPDPKRP